MEKIQQLANEIHHSIEVTIDYPSKNPNGKLPVLDLEQWIEVVDADGTHKNQIMHTHYSKPISSKQVTNKLSALSISSKINILVADLVRVMRNVSRKCSEGERSKHVQLFVHRMQYSGYSQTDRVTVYRKAKKKYENMVVSDMNGCIPLYRSKFWNREERDQKMKEKRRSWYSAGGYETVMFVESTPKEELAKKYRQILKEYGLSIKVVEKSGTTMKQCLCRSDPLKKSSCEDVDCRSCSTSTVHCKARDVVYKVSCAGCGAAYIGETSRSLEERFKEHQRKYDNDMENNRVSSMKEKNGPFAMHTYEKHNGMKQQLQVQILATCPGDAMKRQVTEATYIHDQQPELNTKVEWGNANVSRPKPRDQ